MLKLSEMMGDFEKVRADHERQQRAAGGCAAFVALWFMLLLTALTAAGVNWLLSR